MNPNKVITGLTASQADGLACVVRNVDHLRVRVPHVPVGRSTTGSQVFACKGCLPSQPPTRQWRVIADEGGSGTAQQG
jgi:hypothetical protein